MSTFVVAVGASSRHLAWIFAFERHLHLVKELIRIGSLTKKENKLEFIAKIALKAYKKKVFSKEQFQKFAEKINLKECKLAEGTKQEVIKLHNSFSSN